MRTLYSVVTACLVMLTAASAHAGVNLRWNKCFGEGTGVVNRNFACDTNAGSELLVGSFLSPQTLTNVTRCEAIVDIAVPGSALPAWWQMGAAGCRSGAVSMDVTMDPSNLACEDWSGGLAAGSLTSYQTGVRGSNTARVIMSSEVPAANAQMFIAYVEYFLYNLRIQHSASTGTGACAGCSTPACIIFSCLNVTRSGSTAPVTIFSATNATDSNYSTWQGGGAPTVGGVTGCPAATPTRNTTWGAVKSMYR
ncbi:MAG: hypothetical protein ACKOC6_07810 [bacterium]